MSSDVAVRFDAVTKRYRRRSGGAALRDLLDRSRVDEFLALDGVSFDVGVGASFGLVGDNGAGKTTALRLMTRIARPTSGRVEVRGAVGALIEVGSGIHPELTGRENIELYGRLLGLSRAALADRFDDIVDFSELHHALDQQVKYYSSGMQLRLGFAIASHIDPRILIVDEALAVGDVRFQRKCLERMQQIVAGGATVIYVSHELRTVEAMCEELVWLDRGGLKMQGPTKDVLSSYLEARAADDTVSATAGGALEVLDVELRTVDGRPTSRVRRGDGMEVRVRFRGEPHTSPYVAVGFTSGGPHPFAVCSMTEHGTAPDHVDGTWTAICRIDALPLRRGDHEIWLGVSGADAMTDLVPWHRAARLTVDDEIGRGPRGLTEIGSVVLDHEFSIEPD